MEDQHWLIGRYPVTAVIGAGGFGTVYLGSDPTTGEPVAIKVLDWPDHDNRRELFRQEVAALLAVDHPNVVRVRDVIDVPGLAAIVTEYVEGASLRQVLAQHGPLDGPQALAVLTGALRGLAAVHAVGLVHADLKPENILLDRTGTSRLIDFGLTGPPRWLGGPDTWIGTPTYLAPEVVIGQHIDLRSDLYATAVILFELLTGRPPYVGSDPVMTTLLHVQAPIPDVRQVRADVHDQLAALCAQDLAKDPAARHQNTPAFLTSLDVAATAAYGPGWAESTAVVTTAALSGLVGATLAVLGSAGTGLLGAAPIAGTLALGTAGAAGAAGLAGGAGAGIGAGAGGAGAGGGAVTSSGGALGAVAGSKAAVAAIVAAAAVGAGAATVAVVADDDEPPPVAAAVTAGDVYAYLTSSSTLVVMAGADELARARNAGPAAWSSDRRYVATVAGGLLTLVDTISGTTRNQACADPNGCAGAAVWGDRVATVDGDDLVTYALTDLGDADPVASAPPGITWDTLVATGDSILALGYDDSTNGYRGGPAAMGHRIEADGDVTRFDDKVRSGHYLWEAHQAFSPDSAYGGPRAAILTGGSGGACVYGYDLALVDPERPARSVDTDLSAMLEGAVYEYQTITDVWYDGLGVLRASSSTMVCPDNSYSVLGSPQRVWRLDGTTWTEEDDRALLSSHVLPSGTWLELARVTGADPATVSGTLVLTGADGAVQVAEDVTEVFVPPKVSKPVVPAPTPPSPSDVGDVDGFAAVDGTGDTSALADLPTDFRRFIGGVARSQYRQAVDGGFTSPDCDESATWASVGSFDPRGFARGAVGACGGYAAIWAKRGGTWVEALGTQDAWDCALLVEHQVPASLIAFEGRADCYSYADGFGPYPYYRP